VTDEQQALLDKARESAEEVRLLIEGKHLEEFIEIAAEHLRLGNQ
jgi:hypothetical protein